MKSGEDMSGCSNGTTKKLKGELRDMGGGPGDVGALSVHPGVGPFCVQKRRHGFLALPLSQLEQWVSYFSLWAR